MLIQRLRNHLHMSLWCHKIFQSSGVIYCYFVSFGFFIETDLCMIFVINKDRQITLLSGWFKMRRKIIHWTIKVIFIVDKFWVDLTLVLSNNLVCFINYFHADSNVILYFGIYFSMVLLIESIFLFMEKMFLVILWMLVTFWVDTA